MRMLLSSRQEKWVWKPTRLTICQSQSKELSLYGMLFSCRYKGACALLLDYHMWLNRCVCVFARLHACMRKKGILKSAVVLASTEVTLIQYAYCNYLLLNAKQMGEYTISKNNTN